MAIRYLGRSRVDRFSGVSGVPAPRKPGWRMAGSSVRGAAWRVGPLQLLWRLYNTWTCNVTDQSNIEDARHFRETVPIDIAASRRGAPMSSNSLPLDRRGGGGKHSVHDQLTVAKEKVDRLTAENNDLTRRLRDNHERSETLQKNLTTAQHRGAKVGARAAP